MKKLEVLTESVLQEVDIFMDKYEGTQEQSEFDRLVLDDYKKNTKEWQKTITFSHEEMHLLLAVMYSFTCHKLQTKHDKYKEKVLSALYNGS